MSPRRRILWLLLLLLAAAPLSCTHVPFLGVDPKKVFESEFLTPLDRVTFMAHGGFVFQGHDGWIAFRSREPAQIKDREKYSLVAPEPARRFFLQVDSIDSFSLRSLNVRCLAWEDASKGYSRGKWLLYDPDRGLYWFRTWSHR